MRVFSLLVGAVLGNHKSYIDDSVYESVNMSSYSADDFFSKVVNVNEDNEASIIDPSRAWFIFLSMENCELCREIKPQWDELITTK